MSDQFDERLHNALKEALRHATVPGYETHDGSPFPFVDYMSDPRSSIATGEARIADFAEALTDAVLELLDGAQPFSERDQHGS